MDIKTVQSNRFWFNLSVFYAKTLDNKGFECEIEGGVDSRFADDLGFLGSEPSGRIMPAVRENGVVGGRSKRVGDSTRYKGLNFQ